MGPHAKSDFASNSNDEQLGSRSAATGRKEIFCDGWLYDITDFTSRHPGGAVIEYYTKPGEDATHAIQQFHHRSASKVELLLKSFRRRRPPGELQLHPEDEEKRKSHQALTDDFTKLYLELEREGLFKPSHAHIIYRFVELITLFVTGYYSALSPNLLMQVVAACLLGMAQARSAYLVHEVGHNSLSGNPKIDRFICAVVAGFGAGISGTWWRRKHSRHHAMPQRLDHDIDLATLPVVAYNAKCVKSPAERPPNFWIRHQKYLFIPVDTLLAVLVWQFYRNPRYALKWGFTFEAVCMALRYFTLFAHVGPGQWLFSTWFLAIFLLVNFSLNHSHMPVTGEPTHWVEYGLLHTVDIEHERWCDWWMGYLNYQIEHHLFPNMPQFRNWRIAGRVRALAAKHGLPYQVLSYNEAFRTAMTNLAHVSQELQSEYEAGKGNKVCKKLD